MNRAHVMFVRDSRPLAQIPVRLADGSAQWLTDDEGRIEANLVEGTYVFCVPDLGTGAWREQQVRIESARLTVVDTAPLTFSGILSSASDASFFSERLEQLGGRYRFDRILGRGGMGIVFRATDTILGRPVAIKVLSEELRHDPASQQTFLNEARHLAALEHPNLVAVHDVTAEAGLVLMITEYVEGRNLENWLNERGPLAPEVVARVGLELAEALHYLHENSITHHDVKPGNLMIKWDGALKVIDFGLASSIGASADRGGAQTHGTPAYMAPEQILGAKGDRSADIYQFGITLYELLCDRLPFPPGAEIGYAHVHMEPDPIAEQVSALPAPFARLIHQCLAKSPAERPADAAEIAQRLAALQRGGLVAAAAQMRSIGDVSELELDLFISRAGGPSPLEFDVAVPELSLEEAGIQIVDDGHNDFFGPEERTQVCAPPTMPPQQSPSRRVPLLAALFLLIALGGVAAFFLARGVDEPERVEPALQEPTAAAPPIESGAGPPTPPRSRPRSPRP